MSNGVNDCPKSCLCSNGIVIDYKVRQIRSSDIELLMYF